MSRTGLPCHIPGCPAMGEPVLCAIHRKYLKLGEENRLKPMLCGRCLRAIKPGEWYEPQQTGLALHLKACKPSKAQSNDLARARASNRQDRTSGAA